MRQNCHAVLLLARAARPRRTDLFDVVCADERVQPGLARGRGGVAGEVGPQRTDPGDPLLDLGFVVPLTAEQRHANARGRTPP
jgi:hypothetical protein